MNLSARAHTALTEAAVRQAWRIAGTASHRPKPTLEGDRPLAWGGRRVRWVKDEGQQLQTFVALCAWPVQGAPANTALAGALATPDPSKGSTAAQRLISADSLQARLDAAAQAHRKAQVVISPERPSAKALMHRAATWLGLTSSEGRLPAGLLQSMVDSGLPLRQEMLEQMRALAEWVKATDISGEPLERARQGAFLMMELDKLLRLLQAAQDLVSAGRGRPAGFSREILADLEGGLRGALVSVAQVVAQAPSSPDAMGGDRRWQQVIAIDRLDPASP